MRKLYLLLLSVIVASTAFNLKAVDLYIRGAQFGWNDCTDANKMSTTDDNVYTFEAATLSSNFKIAAGPDWNDTANYGSASNIEPGNEYTLTNGPGSGNITTKGGVALENVKLTFTASTNVLKVEGQAAQAVYPEAIYLVGSFNSWNTSDAQYKLVRQGDTGLYVIDGVNIDANQDGSPTELKFCDGTWDKSWGAANEKDPITIGTEFTPSYNGPNYTLSEALVNAKIEFVYDLNNIESAKVIITNNQTSVEPTIPELYIIGIDSWDAFPENHKFADNNDGTYTLHLDQVTKNANFKIAPLNWNDLDFVYGAPAGQAMNIVNGEALALAKGNNNTANYVVPDDYSDVNITLNLNDMTMKFEGTVTVIEIPEHPEFYLVGTMNNDTAWPTLETSRFVCDEATNTYTISGVNFPANSEFKIAPRNWQFLDIVYGAPEGNTAVVYDSAISLAKGDASKNFVVADAAVNVTLTFQYIPDGTSTLTLTKAGEPVEPEYPELYLRGSFSDWAAQDAWKFTRTDNIYTLSGVELPADAEFKVADNTDSWTVNFGGSGEEGVTKQTLTNGTESPAYSNSSVNFTIAKKLTDVTVTFVYGDAGSVSTIKVEGTEESEEPVDPEYPEHLYVIGQVNGADTWTANTGVELAKNEAVYTLTDMDVVDAGDGFGYFSLATVLGATADDWDGLNAGDRYGADTKDALLTPDAAGTIALFEVNVSASSANSWKVAAGTYDLTADLEHMTILIVRKDTPAPQNPDLYIIGLNGDWNNFPDSNKFVYEEGTNTYTLEIASMVADTNFKIAPLNWGGEGEHLYVFGATSAEDGRITDDKLGNAFDLMRSDTGSFNFVTASPLKNVKITLNIDYTAETYSMIFEGEDETLGVDDVKIENNAGIEYYNLQGVRVLNPDKGLYIVRRGASINKVILK